jgi:hypothetical protein
MHPPVLLALFLFDIAVEDYLAVGEINCLDIA